MLELICTRESGPVFEAGGLNCVLSFIRDSGHLVHKDTLHSAMAVVSRLCGKMEPQDSSLETCVESLSSLLKHEDHQVARELDHLFHNNKQIWSVHYFGAASGSVLFIFLYLICLGFRRGSAVFCLVG